MIFIFWLSQLYGLSLFTHTLSSLTAWKMLPQHNSNRNILNNKKNNNGSSSKTLKGCLFIYFRVVYGERFQSHLWSNWGMQGAYQSQPLPSSLFLPQLINVKGRLALILSLSLSPLLLLLLLCRKFHKINCAFLPRRHFFDILISLIPSFWGPTKSAGIFFSFLRTKKVEN